MATIAISAGHNAGTGARAVDDTDEHCFNSAIVNELYNLLDNAGHKVFVLNRVRHYKYRSAMAELAKAMRDIRADLCLELHFNSASPSANGFEFLHYFKSKKGEKLAQCLGKSFKNSFSGIKQRGVNDGARGLYYYEHDKNKAYSNRGGAYVFMTPCPAVICEPFFASNRSDWEAMKSKQKEIAKAYFEGIRSYLKEV